MLLLSSGGVVYRIFGGKILVLLVSNSNECRLPKGMRDVNETIKNTAIREVKEETGYATIIESYVCSTFWNYRYQDKMYRKKVYWFLMKETGKQTSHDGEYENVFWIDIELAVEKLTFGSEKTVLAKSKEKIKFLNLTDTNSD